ncbi:hypothetical protein L484_017217 [Morus notabilis]|uniref:Uncharacterized protein n=1 Tax=Morus notabilis TaxID=981085 RepID=W9R3J5_9ROSA|nr:hypothetical protein L484_017217 [Morus notabilis]
MRQNPKKKNTDLTSEDLYGCRSGHSGDLINKHGSCSSSTSPNREARRTNSSPQRPDLAFLHSGASQISPVTVQSSSPHVRLSKAARITFFAVFSSKRQ